MISFSFNGSMIYNIVPKGHMIFLSVLIMSTKFKNEKTHTAGQDAKFKNI